PHLRPPRGGDAGAAGAGAAPDAGGHARTRAPRTPLAGDPGRAAAGLPGLRGPGSGAHLRPRPHAVRTGAGGPAALSGALGAVDVLLCTPRPPESAGV